MGLGNLYSEPKLRSPSVVAAWPGMGGVAMIAATYLKDKLQAEEIGEIEPRDFFNPSGVRIQGNILQEPEFPTNKFYLYRGVGEHDLLIFLGNAQPTVGRYTLANLILDTVQKLGVRRVHTLATIPAHIHYTKTPKVLGVGTTPDISADLKRYGLCPMDSGSISGMNGVLLGVAKERNMEAMCLLGETPAYMTAMTNPRASRGILGVLTRMLGVEIDMNDMDVWVEEVDDEMEKGILRLMTDHGEEASRLIEYFEQLKEQAEAEEVAMEDLLGYEDELLRDVDRFLRNQENKGEGGE